MINAKINGINVEVEEGTTIFDAAKVANVKIPTLCKHPDLDPTAACGICVVKIKGSDKMTRSCCTEITEGMEITTHDPELIEVRKTVLELILSNHPNACLTCIRNQNCELQSITAEFGIIEESFEKILNKIEIDESIKTIVLEPEKCIKCGRCTQACQDMQNVWALSFVDRGIKTRITPAADFKLNESPCVSCGQCSAYCPVGSIYEYDEIFKVYEALNDSSKYCVAQIAPAVRVSIGEAFGLKSGEIATKKLYTLLKRMGFKAVFDTNFGADVTIMEEATEFIKRLTTQEGVLPLISSCCPAWVDFMEKFHPDIIPNFSTCKSPHEILASLSKTYYPEKTGIDPSSIFMVSIMPCIAKKFEINRSQEMYASGHQDVDVSITTRELTRMIKQMGIDFVSLSDSEPDHLLANYSGGGTIFGATGGVMEAGLRTINYLLTGKNLEKIEFTSVRGLKGIKEADIKIDDYNLKVAIAHGLGNVEYVINKIRDAREKGLAPPYHFIEVMACPGGCIGGGGQPRNVNDMVRNLRINGLYSDDRNCEYRNCHENPQVKQLYKEFLGEPGGEKSHNLLHLYYKQREEYKGYRETEHLS
ncbi:MAG: NADH-dependent [FeFe] hydrogenase, group A6 [Candidatus Gastranaerophilaceae bacterium]|jgi:NADH-quinone oxidoreductase subunit G